MKNINIKGSFSEVARFMGHLSKMKKDYPDRTPGHLIYCTAEDFNAPYCCTKKIHFIDLRKNKV